MTDSDGWKMIDRRLIRFFRKHHVLTIATSVSNEPWCANCFYVYLEEENALVFTTGIETRHGKEFAKNALVAGSVVLETMVIGKIRGIQFQGIVSEPEGEMISKDYSTLTINSLRGIDIFNCLSSKGE